MPLTLGATDTTLPTDSTCLTCLTLTVGAVVIDDLGDEVGVHGKPLRSPSSNIGSRPPDRLQTSSEAPCPTIGKMPWI